MGERKTPILIRRSGLTGTIYAVTSYKVREDGLVEVRANGKHDVTADVESIVAERCAPLVEALEAIATIVTSIPAERMREYDGEIEYLAREALRVFRAGEENR